MDLILRLEAERSDEEAPRSAQMHHCLRLRFCQNPASVCTRAGLPAPSRLSGPDTMQNRHWEVPLESCLHFHQGERFATEVEVLLARLVAHRRVVVNALLPIHHPGLSISVLFPTGSQHVLVQLLHDLEDQIKALHEAVDGNSQHAVRGGHIFDR